MTTQSPTEEEQAMPAAKQATKKAAPRPRRPKQTPTLPTWVQDYIQTPEQLAEKLGFVDPDTDEMLGYVNRDLPGQVSDFDVFDTYANQKPKPEPLLLEGPTSTGKTVAIEAHSAARKRVLVTLIGSSGFDETDLYGRYAPGDKADEVVWVDGKVTLAGRISSQGIPVTVFVDEVGLTDPAVNGALMSLLDYRGVFTVKGSRTQYVDEDGVTRYKPEEITVGKDLWVVAATNPGYTGTNEQNQAFRNRFQPLEWGYDTDVESYLLGGQVLQEFIAALRAIEGTKIFTPVATAQFIQFERNAATLGWDFAKFALLSYFSDERAVVEKILDDGFESRMCDEYGITLSEEA